MASYGVAGNNGNIGGNNAYTTYASGAGSSFYGITGGISTTSQGFYQNQIGNPNVTWEKDKISNIGVDATVFKHLDLTVEVWKKAISGLLFAAQYSSSWRWCTPPFCKYWGCSKYRC